jgi:hypothetical protein
MRSIASIAAAATKQLDKLPAYQLDLVYVDYRDQFGPEQVEELLRGGYCDHTDEWISERQWESARDIADELFKDLCDEDKYDELEAEWGPSDERHELIFEIQQRDTSDPYRDLLRNTGNMLFRFSPSEDDMHWLDADVLNAGADAVRREMDLPAEWLPALDTIVPEIQGYAAEGGGYFGATIVFRANPSDLYGLSEDSNVRVHEPFLWLTNPWCGNGYGEVATGVTATLRVGDIHTDKAAWGYSTDAVFGGLYIDDSTITPVQEEAP